MSGQVPPLRSLRGTALARLIDLRYATNRTAVAGAALAGAATLIGEATLGDGASLPTAVRVGVGTFLAWALARELAPDHPLAASLAMIPAAALSPIATPAIGPLVVALLAIRMWAGTVGHHPSIIDLGSAFLVAAYAGSGAAMWLPAAALAGAIVAHSPHRKPAVATAILMILAAASVAALTGAAEAPDLSAVEIGTLVVVAAALALILPIRNVTSRTDRRDQAISPGRIGASWIAAAIAVFGLALFEDVASAGPLLAAGLTTGFSHLAEGRKVEEA